MQESKFHTFNSKHILILMVFLILVSGLIYSSFWAYRVYVKVDELRSIANRILSTDLKQMQSVDITAVVDLSKYALADLDDLNNELDGLYPLMNKLGFLPFIGKYLPEVEPGLRMATNLTEAVVVIGDSAVPLLSNGEDDRGLKTLQVLSDYVIQSQKDFGIAESLLDNAASARKQFDGSIIPEKYQDELAILDRVLLEYPKMFDAILVVPNLLGNGDAITYLLLVQNRDELRASGGFITAFGLLKMKDGRILGLRVDDSTEYKQFDYVSEIRKAPFPMEKIMFAHYLVARDANWSPDFPTAAAGTQDIYTLSTGIQTDAVIGFDQDFIRDLLGVIGPITLDEENITIDSSNVEQIMIEYKEAAIANDKSLERKEFLSIMTPYLLEKLLKIRDPGKMLEMAQFLEDSIRQGHLLIFSEDAQVESVLDEFGIDGAVRPRDGDFLMLVDSNVGFGKIDQFIDRSVAYSVDLTKIDQPQGEIRLKYEHTEPGTEVCYQGQSENELTSYFDSRCYWDYWRVLTAGGTTFEEIILEPIPEAYFQEGTNWDQKGYLGSGENGTSMAGGLVVVEQMSEKEVVLKTSIPAEIIQVDDEGNVIYSLRIQKQPGISSMVYNLKIHAPTGTILKDLPDGWRKDTNGTSYSWSGKIIQTTDIKLEFMKSE